METLVINIPYNKSALVKQLLKELGVTIMSTTTNNKSKTTPNALTIVTIENAHKGTGLGEPIKDVGEYIESL